MNNDCSGVLHIYGYEVPCENGRFCRGRHDNEGALGHHISWTNDVNDAVSAA